MLENSLIAHATNGVASNLHYTYLRKFFMDDPVLARLLPPFVRTCRTLDMFWQHIKKAAPTFAERRTIIGEAFTPLLDHLEGRNRAPGDTIVSDALETFDAEGVHAVWPKPSTAETPIRKARSPSPGRCWRASANVSSMISARNTPKKKTCPSSMESCRKAAEHLSDQHSEEPIKAILGGAMNLVNGIGTLRNRSSDSHGRGGKPVRPSPRHASLAVNTAGAIATFLVETHVERATGPIKA